VSDDPIITELAAIPLQTRPPGHRRRSPAVQWVETHFAEIVEHRARASWEEIAELCRKHGLTDGRGNPISVYQLVSAYSRIKRAAKGSERRR
jgi:hypothetical protein